MKWTPLSGLKGSNCSKNVEKAHIIMRNCLIYQGLRLRRGKFYLWTNKQYQEKTTDLTQVTHSQKWWVLCSFAYLRWRRRGVCNFHMIYIDDIIHNCMCVIFWTWKWYIESSWMKWNKNSWKQLNIQGSWTKWKSEATSPYLALRVYVKMSEIHETGGVWYKI
jgi:hypothetical protein